MGTYHHSLLRLAARRFHDGQFVRWYASIFCVIRTQRTLEIGAPDPDAAAQADITQKPILTPTAQRALRAAKQRGNLAESHQRAVRRGCGQRWVCVECVSSQASDRRAI